MRQKIDRTKRLVFIIILIEAAVIAFFWFGLKANVLSAMIILVLETAGAFLLFDRVEDAIEEETTGVKQMLGSTARQAYLTGEIGMVIYDDDYVVTWMSELFTTRGINRVGHKLLTWIPEADDLIAGRSDTATVRLDDKIYEIRRSEDSQIIFFRDVTERRRAQEQIVHLTRPLNRPVEVAVQAALEAGCKSFAVSLIWSMIGLFSMTVSPNWILVSRSLI